MGCCSGEQGLVLHLRVGSWAAPSTFVWDCFVGRPPISSLGGLQSALQLGCPCPGIIRGGLHPGQGWQQAVLAGWSWLAGWLVPRAPVPSLPLPPSPHTARAEAVSRCPAALQGICSIGVCSCISKYLVKKIKTVPSTLREKCSGRWWPVLSTAGGCPVRVSHPSPGYPPGTALAHVPSSACSRSHSIANSAGQFWLYTRQLDNGSCFTCQHEYNPPAKPALPRRLLGFT